jgi:hypothetical protein
VSGYEIFCSYAHLDNDDGWIDEFASTLATTFRKLTGQQPEVFVDRESLITSDIWEARIRTALQRSRVLLAVVSPSYIRSEWCRREWAEFAARETAVREQGDLAEDRGLIFPILLFPLHRGHFDEGEREFAAAVAKRQWLDVSSQVEGTPIRPDQVRRLAEQIIDTVAGIEVSRRHAKSAADSIAAGTTIRDPSSGLEWTAALSPTELTYEEAIAYVSDLTVAGHTDWRLPTREDLRTLIDTTLIDEDPTASPYPLREPFNSQRSGYLHSGTLVPGQRERSNFIMNPRNGHIFNGQGYRCWVRSVRTLN